MYHLIREENIAEISTVVQNMNVVLHEMYEWAALNRQEAIRGTTFSWPQQAENL